MIITLGGGNYQVIYTEDPHEITEALGKSKAKIITYDTETTGLHIIADKPFLGAICFEDLVYVFPTNKTMLARLPLWAGMVSRIYGANVGFDMHMTANAMEDNKCPLQIRNWGDIQCLARLSYEAISQDEPGGHKLALKYIGKKFIDPEADKYEKDVKHWISEEKKRRRKVLLTMLKPFKILAKEVDRIVKERALGARFDHEEAEQIYQGWAADYPEVTYQDVPLDIMIPYLAVDVILTKAFVYKALPVVMQRDQLSIMNKEFRLLTTVYKMERAGIVADQKYLEDSLQRLLAEVDRMYTELRDIVGDPTLKVGQHKKINEMYETWLGETLKSSDKQFLRRMSREYKESKEGKAATLISRLRRFEKWIAAYIVRIQEVSKYNGRFYTQMSQFSPVTGRFSGGAQQFPKEAILTQEGYEYEEEHGEGSAKEEHILYHPRRVFKGYMYYLDYSQVELRVQGHYTLQFGGDLNLCRAYMPFNCTHYRTGETYDFTTVVGRARWNELREGYPDPRQFKDGLEEVLKLGWSVWINPDTNESWIPTDVHSATTVKALAIMGIDVGALDKKEFKYWRNIGKRFNFMRTYGGGDNKAAETLEIAIEAGKAMNKGFSEAFPVILTYQKWVENEMWKQGYCPNPCGRRYYLSEHWRFYKVGNYMIQGYCADMLKEKMIEIDDYMEEHNLWDVLPMILCVHDELQFENINRNPALEEHIWNIKAIMEDLPDVLVPIVAEVEKTETTWADKTDLHKVA